MSRDQFATIRQSLPRLWGLLRHVEPTFHLDSAGAIDRNFLNKHDIHAVLWDVDGTLMSYHASGIDPTFAHISALFREGPGRHAILSNCDEERFVRLGEMFPELPVVRGYTTDNGQVYRHLLRGEDTHSAEQVAALRATGARQIRKPSGDLVRYAMLTLGETDPHAVLMVGDQYLTDIASANLAGVRSAKVPTWRRNTFPRMLRVSQAIERGLYRLRRTS